MPKMSATMLPADLEKNARSCIVCRPPTRLCQQGCTNLKIWRDDSIPLLDLSVGIFWIWTLFVPYVANPATSSGRRVRPEYCNLSSRSRNEFLAFGQLKVIRFEGSTAVAMEIAVIRDVTQYGSRKNRLFGGTYRLHHHGKRVCDLVTANVVPSS
jgi:hypothetical protein